MAAVDQLTGLMSIINGLKGSSSTTSTSGGTTTTQANVSDAGVNQLIEQILSGSGGVKTIGTQARSSGLYNSSTEDTLLSKLYATAANQAELARTPTTVTTSGQSQTTKTAGTSAGDLATGLGGAFLASQALNIGSKALSPAVSAGTNYVSDLLGSLFGTSGGGTTSSKGLLDDVDFSVGGGFNSGNANSGGSISTGEGYGLNTSSLQNFGSSQDVSDAKGISFGFDTDSGATSANIGGLGSIGSLLGAVVGGLGGSSGGSGGGSSGGSVICTALMKQGLLDADLYAAGDKYIQRVNIITKVGYYVWARKIAAKIDKGHKGWTKVCLPFAIGRTALLASGGSLADHIKHPLGALTKFVGEPTCFLIGLFGIGTEKFAKVVSMYRMKGV